LKNKYQKKKKKKPKINKLKIKKKKIKWDVVYFNKITQYKSIFNVKIKKVKK
jgi:hypothetical protein